MKRAFIPGIVALAATFTALALPAPAITSEETEDVLFMKQEEKLARDVYRFLQTKWEQPIFVNIAASEQNHMDAVNRLIVANGLVEEEYTDAPGDYSYPELVDAYKVLTEKGSVSLQDAYEVGVIIETLDIEDLEECLAETATPSVERVFTNLLAGSENHLRAFTSALKKIQ